MRGARATVLATLLGALGLPLAAPATAQAPWAPARVRLAMAREQARNVETELSRLPAVAEARAQVWLPDPLDTPVDQAPERPRLAVRLRLRRGAQRDPGFDARVRQLAASQVPGASAERVEVALDGAAPLGPPEAAGDGSLVRVGPFQASARSAPWLRGTLGALLGALLILAAVLARYARRAMRDGPAA